MVRLCCCTAEVLTRVPRFNAIEGVQEGAEKLLAGQRIDGLWRHSVLICRWRVISRCITRGAEAVRPRSTVQDRARRSIWFHRLPVSIARTRATTTYRPPQRAAMTAIAPIASSHSPYRKQTACRVVSPATPCLRQAAARHSSLSSGSIVGSEVSTNGVEV